MAGSMKNSIKGFISQTCHQLGLFKLLFSRNKDAVIVFMLHAVTDDECNRNSDWKPLWKRAHVDELETAIQALKPYVDFIDMDEATRRLSGDVKATRPGVVFTFDDGYSNNISHAYPVLRRHQVPMMIYFATGFIGNKKLFWIDEFDYLLQMQSNPKFSVKLDQQTYDFDTSNRNQLKKDYKYFRQSLRKAYPDERDMLAQLDLAKQQLDPTGELLKGEILQNPLLRILGDEEIVALPEGVDVGCHTVNHLRIGELGRDIVDPEIRDAKTYLEDLTGDPCLHFCYPVGSFSDEAVASAREAGFDSSVTVREKINKPGVDLMLIDRLAFPDVQSQSQLLMFISKFLLKS